MRRDPILYAALSLLSGRLTAHRDIVVFRLSSRLVVEVCA
jgi:hypothetical protein